MNATQPKRSLSKSLLISTTFTSRFVPSELSRLQEVVGQGCQLCGMHTAFMAIFDAVRLCGDTTLIFFFNPQLKGEVEALYERVSSLILKYAGTLQSKNHGDNLFHKLILENRIKILPLSIKLQNSELGDKENCG